MRHPHRNPLTRKQNWHARTSEAHTNRQRKAQAIADYLRTVPAPEGVLWLSDLSPVHERAALRAAGATSASDATWRMVEEFVQQW